MGILANENSIGGGNYLIERSLRFQSASSQYLSRTPASTTNQKTFTWSGWVKRGALSADETILGTADSGTFTYNIFIMRFTTTDTIRIIQTNSSGLASLQFDTTAVFRDPSAWYHVVLYVDTTQATNSNGLKLYINNVLQSGTYAAYTQNTNTSVNSTTFTMYHGRYGIISPAGYFDGYMAEVNFIDGQALTPSSFGETDALTGVWVAKRYTGTYGTNGFYLRFNDGTSTTTLGQDRSGNANNWTLTNFTRSAGVSDCWMYDVPSGNGSPSATQPSSNYAVLNSLSPTSVTVSNGNLQATYASTWKTVITTMQIPSTGKWYWECTATSIGTPASQIGIASSSTPLTSYFGFYAGGYAYQNNATKMNNNSGVSYGATYATNDVIGVAFNADTLDLTFYKNGVSQGSAYTVTAGDYFAAIALNGATAAVAANFGQRSFAYTPPSGFKALCTANLPAPTIAKGNQYMDATLYTGNGSARSITNAAGFSPEFVWIKERSSTSSHQLFDVVRGATKNLESNTTSAEGTFAQTLSSFNADGFSLGTDSAVNENTQTYVAWQWDAGSSTVTNTSGTISSQVRASTTAGFSIVTYTGTGANATVGHGLGVAPKMVIVKRRDNGVGATNWWVYHAGLNAGVNPQQYNIKLNLTSAQAGLTAAWNDTAPTSTVFTVGTSSEINGSGGTFVAYVFSEIAGFSRFGFYTGNGSTDGPFIYLGFRPKFVMVKIYSGTTGDWAIFDTSRSTYNEEKLVLWPNLSIAESTGSNGIDGLANGFKIRSASNYINGTSSYSYIYMAFAENPFSVSNAR